MHPAHPQCIAVVSVSLENEGKWKTTVKAIQNLVRLGWHHASQERPVYRCCLYICRTRCRKINKHIVQDLVCHGC